MAQDPKYKDVQFISICCDKLDGARDIIERDDDLRWQNINHYFMEKKDKEIAKEALGFKSVPYYVVLDEEGNIRQAGSDRQVDFDIVPGVVRPETPPPSPTPVEGDESSESSFDNIGIEADFCLDFANKAGLHGDNESHPAVSCSTIPIIDQNLFDNDDF
jgi:hypothetical protein